MVTGPVVDCVFGLSKRFDHKRHRVFVGESVEHPVAVLPDLDDPAPSQFREVLGYGRGAAINQSRQRVHRVFPVVQREHDADSGGVGEQAEDLHRDLDVLVPGAEVGWLRIYVHTRILIEIRTCCRARARLVRVSQGLRVDGRTAWWVWITSASVCGSWEDLSVTSPAAVDRPLALVAERVRDRLRSEFADLSRDADRAARVAQEEVRRHNDYALARGLVPIDDEQGGVREILATVSGYGVLQGYLEDPTVEELWINSPDRIFVARAGVSERVPLSLTDAAVRDVVERMLHSTGRRVDLSQPFVDASLPDGSRLHVVIPDITRSHWAVNIRKFLPEFRTLAQLVDAQALDPSAAELLARGMTQGRSVLVSGATHAGKTTLLGALIAACPRSQRIVTVEETFELSVAAPDIVALQGRQPSLEGTGEVPLRRLVKEALRMRPDRLVVGEVRDAEALDLLLALNTGVPGAATIHANSANDALEKLSALPLLAGRNIDSGFVLPAVAAAVDLVVHCEKSVDGHRRVTEIIRPDGVCDGAFTTTTLYRADR